MCGICARFNSAIPCKSRSCCWSQTRSGCIPSRNCVTPARAGYRPRLRTCPFISTWPRARRRHFRLTFAPASKRWRRRTARWRDPRASGETSRCPRSNISPSDAVAPARQADHGRDQEQHHGDKEDRLGDFDGHAGDTAEAQNARNQRDDQERNDPAQHGPTLYPLVSKTGATESLAPCWRNNPAPELMFPPGKPRKISISREQNRGWFAKTALAATTG